MYAKTMMIDVPNLFAYPLLATLSIVPVTIIADLFQKRYRTGRWSRTSSYASLLENVLLPATAAVIVFIPIYWYALGDLKSPLTWAEIDIRLYQLTVEYVGLVVVVTIMRLIIKDTRRDSQLIPTSNNKNSQPYSANLQARPSSLIENLRQNLGKLQGLEEEPLSQASLPKSHGVYELFFEGELKYVGSSENLDQRIRRNLLSGNRKSHTLINKLCTLRKWEVSDAVSWLKNNSKIKFIETETDDDAKILEDFLIAIYHPHFNTPLRILKKQEVFEK